jgi:hypothetical protein
MMKKMGSGGLPGDGNMPSMDESLQAMSEMMKSPLFQEFLSDPDKLEQSRQMILSNPMLKNLMSSMPGMGPLLDDPNAWRDAMQAAAQLYQNLDPQVMKQALSGVGGGAGLESLFGGADKAGLLNGFDTSSQNDPTSMTLEEMEDDE